MKLLALVLAGVGIYFIAFELDCKGMMDKVDHRNNKCVSICKKSGNVSGRLSLEYKHTCLCVTEKGKEVYKRFK